MIQVSRAKVQSPRIQGGPYTFAFVSDLHNSSYDDILLSARGADAILVTGDLLDRHHPGMEHAVRFIRQAPEVAPVFFSIGNHEVRSEEWPQLRSMMLDSGITILDDSFVLFRDIVLGGLSSRDEHGFFKRHLKDESLPAIRTFLKDMCSMEGFRLLLCHHPEYYPAAIQESGIDLTLSGHAHGGQIQLFGRGVYAPGQGLFPRYTHDFYDGGRLLVSRGMSNQTPAPRLFNPCEMILLTLESGEPMSTKEG